MRTSSCIFSSRTLGFTLRIAWSKGVKPQRLTCGGALARYLQLGALELPVSLQSVTLTTPSWQFIRPFFALNVGGAADTTDVPKIFMNERVEALALM